MLNGLEHDAITELLNVAVGRAAVALSRMVSHPVAMSVPAVRMLSRAEALSAVGDGGSAPLIAVSEQFSGPFSGSALLIFPEARSLRLVQMILGEHVAIEDIAELADDAMSEVGNVILNSCLSGIANMIGCRIEATLPLCSQGRAADIFRHTLRDKDHAGILFMSIHFAVRDRDIGGCILLLLDLNAIASLRQALDTYVARLLAAAGPA